MSIWASKMQPVENYSIHEYLSCTGAAYIDTKFKPTQTSSVEVKAQSFQTTDASIFGVDSGWVVAGFAVFVHYGEFGTQSAPFTFYSSNAVTVKMDKNKVYQDGTLKQTFTNNAFTSKYNLYIMALNRSGTAREYLSGKVYYCKIWDNGTLVHDMVPAMRGKDKAVGFYDKITQSFYESTGSGLTCGPQTGSIGDSTKTELVTRRVAALVAHGENAAGTVPINRSIGKVYRAVDGVVRQVFPDVLAAIKFIVGPEILANLQFMLSGDGSGGRTPGTYSSAGNGILISHNECGGSMFITTEKVNVSKYSKLSARAIAYVNNSRTSMDFCVMLFTSMPADINRRTYYSYYNWYFKGFGGTKLVEAASEHIYPYNVGVPCSAVLDLSKIYGEYYIALEVINNHNGSRNGSITIDSFMLE